LNPTSEYGPAQGEKGANLFQKMKLYRAVSMDEYQDFSTDEVFRTTNHTLEAKQFFKSEMAVWEFVMAAIKQSYCPPYEYILTIDIDNQCFEAIGAELQNLDGHDAITIQEENLKRFNNCIIFVVIQYVELSLHT
jgi:hypothetical protein